MVRVIYRPSTGHAPRDFNTAPARTAAVLRGGTVGQSFSTGMNGGGPMAAAVGDTGAPAESSSGAGWWIAGACAVLGLAGGIFYATLHVK